MAYMERCRSFHEAGQKRSPRMTQIHTDSLMSPKSNPSSARICVICGSTGFRSSAPGTQPPKQIPHPPTRRSPSVAPPWHSSSITASPQIPYSPPMYKNVYSPPSQSLTSRESPKLRRRGPGAVPESQSSPEYRIVPRDFVKTNPSKLAVGGSVARRDVLSVIPTFGLVSLIRWSAWA